MIHIDIPGIGEIHLEVLVSDFTGTLACGGVLIPGVKEKLVEVSRQIEIVVLTADTFGTVRRELDGVPCRLEFVRPPGEKETKERFVRSLDAERVVALGNGKNDASMLKVARVGIATLNAEGCASSAISSADIVVRDVCDALDLLREPLRLRAVLRS
jgi:P-type E1-E2 ATPase